MVDLDNAEKRDSTGGWIGPVALSVIFIAVVSGICAFLTHQGCFHPGPPVSRPVLGTARAEYCDAINGAHPWLSLTIIPCVVTGILAFILRRNVRWVLAVTLLVSLVVIANAAVANSLTYSVTI